MKGFLQSSGVISNEQRSTLISLSFTNDKDLLITSIVLYLSSQAMVIPDTICAILLVIALFSHGRKFNVTSLNPSNSWIALV